MSVGMHPQPQRFRKLPVEVTAMQWDGTAFGAGPLIDWIIGSNGTARYHEAETLQSYLSDEVEHVAARIAVDTLEGTVYASAGDWIIRVVAGELYPCKPEIFAATYEAVSQ